MFLSNGHINTLHPKKELATLDIPTQKQRGVKIFDSYNDCASSTSSKSTPTYFEVVSAHNYVIESKQMVHIPEQEPITISCVHENSYSVDMD